MNSELYFYHVPLYYMKSRGEKIAIIDAFSDTDCVMMP